MNTVNAIPHLRPTLVDAGPGKLLLPILLIDTISRTFLRLFSSAVFGLPTLSSEVLSRTAKRHRITFLF